MTTMMIYDDGGDGDDTMTKTIALTTLQGSLSRTKMILVWTATLMTSSIRGEFWCRRWAELGDDDDDDDAGIVVIIVGVHGDGRGRVWVLLLLLVAVLAAVHPFLSR